MNDFKRNDRFGGKRTGSRPPYQRSGGGFSRPQGQMHQATCAQCGKSCEVPFRPNGQRPVYCRDCFGGAGQSTAPRATSERPYHSTPRFQSPAPAPVRPQALTPDPRIDDLMRRVAKMQLKLDKILLELAVNKAQEGIATETKITKKGSRKK